MLIIWGRYPLESCKRSFRSRNFLNPLLFCATRFKAQDLCGWIFTTKESAVFTLIGSSCLILIWIASMKPLAAFVLFISNLAHLSNCCPCKLAEQRTEAENAEIAQLAQEALTASINVADVCQTFERTPFYSGAMSQTQGIVTVTLKTRYQAGSNWIVSSTGTLGRITMLSNGVVSERTGQTLLNGDYGSDIVWATICATATAAPSAGPTAALPRRLRLLLQRLLRQRLLLLLHNHRLPHRPLSRRAVTSCRIPSV